MRSTENVPVSVRDVRAALRIVVAICEKEVNQENLRIILRILDAFAYQAALPDLTPVILATIHALDVFTMKTNVDTVSSLYSSRLGSLLSTGRFDRGLVHSRLAELLQTAESVDLVQQLSFELEGAWLDGRLYFEDLSRYCPMIRKVLIGKTDLTRWAALRELVRMLRYHGQIDDEVMAKAYESCRSVLLRPASENDLTTSIRLIPFLLGGLGEVKGEYTETLATLIELLRHEPSHEVMEASVFALCGISSVEGLSDADVRNCLRALASVLATVDDPKVTETVARVGSDDSYMLRWKSPWSQLSLTDLSEAANHQLERLTTLTEWTPLWIAAEALDELSECEELANRLDVRPAAARMLDLIDASEKNHRKYELLTPLAVLSHFASFDFDTVERGFSYAEEILHRSVRGMGGTGDSNDDHLHIALKFLARCSNLKGVPEARAESIAAYLVEVLGASLDQMEEDSSKLFSSWNAPALTLVWVTSRYVRTPRLAKQVLKAVTRSEKVFRQRMEATRDEPGMAAFFLSKVPGIEPHDFDELIPTLTRLSKEAGRARAGDPLLNGYTVRAVSLLVAGREEYTGQLDGLIESALCALGKTINISETVVSNFAAALQTLAEKGDATVVEYPSQMLRAALYPLLKDRPPLSNAEAEQMSRYLPRLIPGKERPAIEEILHGLHEALLEANPAVRVERTMDLLDRFRSDHPYAPFPPHGRGHLPALSRALSLAKGADLGAGPEEMLGALPLLVLCGHEEEAGSLFGLLEHLQSAQRRLEDSDTSPPGPMDDEVLEHEEVMSPSWMSLMTGMILTNTGQEGVLERPWAGRAEEVSLVKYVLGGVRARKVPGVLNFKSLGEYVWACYSSDSNGSAHLRTKLWNYLGLHLIVDAPPSGLHGQERPGSVLPDVLVEARELLSETAECMDLAHGCHDMATVLREFLSQEPNRQVLDMGPPQG